MTNEIATAFIKHGTHALRVVLFQLGVFSGFYALSGSIRIAAGFTSVSLIFACIP